jgi:hypothetical protein
LVGKYAGKRLIGRPRRKWENYIKIVLKIGKEFVDWFYLPQDRYRWQAFVNVMKSQVHNERRYSSPAERLSVSQTSSATQSYLFHS